MDNIYWTTKLGTQIAVDDMDEKHAKNALKMIIKNQGKVVKEYNLLVRKYNRIIRLHSKNRHRFQMNGEMAQEEVDKRFDEQTDDWDYFQNVNGSFD
jgi:hypothetical protein